ncbi:hypothetical protein Leryth_010550 [Lithospermum erythrorhizon]|nr:hypothetical protein Leryth_010550 [Lithospermum erythrorhizon]
MEETESLLLDGASYCILKRGAVTVALARAAISNSIVLSSLIHSMERIIRTLHSISKRGGVPYDISILQAMNQVDLN